MNERRLGRTELKVSELGLGALEIGAAYGIGEECGEVPGEEEAVALLRCAMESGVTLFDTAGVYGLSEYRIGRFLATTDWRPVLTSKLMVRRGEEGQWLDYATERPYESIGSCVDHQVQRTLRNLGVDTLDVMQLHGYPADDGDLLEGMIDALKAHVGAGRIRFLGASCTGQQVPDMVERGCFATVQLCYNLFDQSERERGLKLAADHDLGVLLRSPMALGVVADKRQRMEEARRRPFDAFLGELHSRLPEGMSVPEAALRFVLSQPAVSSALVGTRNPEHLRSNARAADGAGLPAEVLDWIEQQRLSGTLPEWSWSDHFRHDWPSGHAEANLQYCRSVD